MSPSFKSRFLEHQEPASLCSAPGTWFSFSLLSLFLFRNCGSSRAPMSFTGSVLTPGCSNTTRVRFACSIFLVGLRHGIFWFRGTTYPWVMQWVHHGNVSLCIRVYGVVSAWRCGGSLCVKAPIPVVHSEVLGWGRIRASLKTYGEGR